MRRLYKYFILESQVSHELNDSFSDFSTLFQLETKVAFFLCYLTFYSVIDWCPLIIKVWIGKCTKDKLENGLLLLNE